MTIPYKSFHNSYDLQVRAYQTYTEARGWMAGGRYITLRERKLNYQFFSHFHPYVLPLVQRLNQGGISELLDSDTLYLPQPSNGQPLTVLPNSTRAALSATMNATRPDGTMVSLSAGTPLTLPDGTQVNIRAGTLVAHPDGQTSKLGATAYVVLPGNLPISSSSGIQWNIEESQTIVPDYTAVTLDNNTLAVLTNDGSSVNLLKGTEVTIRSGLPQPFFYDKIFDEPHYNPNSTAVLQPYPVKNLDFTLEGAYSIYNWELFFHAPLLIAVHLSQNQKFQDAQKWFHYIFNPTDNSPGPTPERFWKVQPFQYTDVKMIEQILVNLSKPQDPQLFNQTVSSINNWKQKPFQPFEVAKYRPTASMLKTIMAYLDNLIDWGDSLFQQYTIETINEATQLYVMAANILGPKPQPVPKKGSVKPLTYNDLRGKYLFCWDEIPADNGELIDFLNKKFNVDWVKTATIDKINNENTISVSNGKHLILLKLNSEKPRVNLEIDGVETDELIAKTENSKLNIYLRSKLDEIGNALVDMEVDIPFDIAPHPAPGMNPVGNQILPSIGQTLYFCIPRNDKLLRYWDTVADRLFKIHNSLNPQGVFQKLPLYEPPIDPALLVRAAAAGLEVNAIVSGLNQPLPLVRFELLVSKATEICQEVKSLGANLLAAMEKKDNEAMVLMRAQHESNILGLAKMVKYSQWQDAIKARQGLEQSLANAVQSYTRYQKSLGNTDTQIQSNIPKLDALDQGSLQNLKFSQSGDSSEPRMPFDPIKVDIAQDSTQVSDGEIKTISRHESEEIVKLQDARNKQNSAAELEQAASFLAGVLTDMSVSFWTVSLGPFPLGASSFSRILDAYAKTYRDSADSCTYEANKTAKLGSYSRREEEWLFQSNQAKGEINQTLKQLRGAQIREAIAQKEYENHQIQMQQAQEIVDFLQGKETNSSFQVKETTIGFYAWMKREAKALYAKSFQLAFEVARKAERALQHELGDPTLSYIQYNYLDGTEGLMAGEKLLLDIKAMEMAYHDLNQREYELTKHVSLLQVAPISLIQLRATGTCTFTLPEELFDMDGPGHYFRRIKSVAVTIPCVTGPYTSVSCTLTLQKSSIRIKTDLPREGYQRKGSEDDRFNDYYGTFQSIVTSSGQLDSGLFETNLKDERYLPFERAGIAGSQWQLTLPSDVRQFDFDTITDVILHVRYTAREGGDILKAAAVQNLQNQINKAQTVGSVRLFSVRHEFPTEWAKFTSVKIEGDMSAELTLNLRPEYYPFWSKDKDNKPIVLKQMDFFAKPTKVTKDTIKVFDKPKDEPVGTRKEDKLEKYASLKDIRLGKLKNITLPAAIGKFTLYLDDNSIEDLWLALTWGK